LPNDALKEGKPMPQAREYVDGNYLEMAAKILAPLKERSYACMRMTGGERVVDVGCGPGIDTVALAELVGPDGQVVGVDLDGGMLEEADRRAKSARPPATVRHTLADACSLPFEAEAFDAARSERLFQHLPRPAEALAEMSRVVKANGWLVVVDTDWATLSLDSLEPDIERRLVRFHAEKSMYNGYAGRQLYRLFRQQNLSDVSIEVLPQSMTDCGLARRCIGLEIAEKNALQSGVLSRGELDRWHANLDAAAAEGTFFASWNMVLVAGRNP